jgi:hypothetical protein
MNALACDMDLAPLPDGASAVSFRLRNDGSEPVEVSWFEPFVSFGLEAEVDGAPARVVGGVYDGGVRRMQDVLAIGEERRIATPVTLAFDPGPALPDPGPQTRWRISHAPADTVLRATLELGSERLSCEATLSP